MLRVLVVDDEATILRNVARSLHTAGFQVVTAINCESAILALNSSQVDALCLDVMLPDGNGLDLLEEIRQSLPGIPAVLISSALCPRTRARAAELGVQHFLPKPFSLAELKNMLTSALVAT